MFFMNERFFLFLVLLFAAYWLSPSRWRNGVLLIGTVAWLALFSPSTLVVISVLALGVVYPLAWLAQRLRDSDRRKGAWVSAWVGIAILLLTVSLLRLKTYFLPGLTVSISAISSN